MVPPSASRVVLSEAEFTVYVTELWPQLLDHAAAQTRRFLRESGQWENDVVHEKQAQRWGYELLERFLLWGRKKVPCRPVRLFDSFLFKHYSEPGPWWIQEDAASPLWRFLDGLVSRAVHSRDALVATYYHLYGLEQQHVAKVLALGPAESQRIYKNYMRWRSTGWPRMIQDLGLSEEELRQLSEESSRHPARLQSKAESFVQVLQDHYRKSEPALYPCRSRSQWRELYDKDCDRDYRSWHLPFCRGCLTKVWGLSELTPSQEIQPRLNVHVYPLSRAAVLQPCS